jgi:hypothetical protein
MSRNRDIVSSREIRDWLRLEQTARLRSVDLNDVYGLIRDERQEIAAGVEVLAGENGHGRGGGQFHPGVDVVRRHRIFYPPGAELLHRFRQTERVVKSYSQWQCTAISK